MCSLWSHLQYVSIGSGIGLAPNRQQPIAWTNDDPVHKQIHTYIHTYIHTCLLLLISMLWHRQAIFKSKGDKLCSSAECRIWTRGPRHQIASRLNARWQTDWAIEDQAKNLNSTARPYDQRAFQTPTKSKATICMRVHNLGVIGAIIGYYVCFGGCIIICCSCSCSWSRVEVDVAVAAAVAV